jgi:hypothetical protein
MPQSGTNSLSVQNFAIVKGLTYLPEPVNEAQHPAFVFWHRLNDADFSGAYLLGIFFPTPVTTFETFSGQPWNAETRCIGHAWQGQLLPMTLYVDLVLDSGTGIIPTGWIDSAGPVLTEFCQ